MKKICGVLILVVGVMTNSYAGISIGLKGGYVYQSLTPKEVHEITKITTGTSTTTTDSTYTPTGEGAETKHPNGFGGGVLFEIIPPVIPVGVELNVGFYTGSFTETEEICSTYTVNSIKVSALGKYYIKGPPMISPWVGVGPFIGLTTHKSKVEDLNMTFEGDMVPNFGILGGAGANIGIVPKLSLNIGILFDYFIESKGKSTMKYTFGETVTETTSEVKFSQWNINALIGVSYGIM